VTKKWGEKTREKFFLEHSNSIGKKYEKIFGKMCEKTFFIIIRMSWQKNGGKNARNNFSRNTRILRSKYVGKKIFGKSAKKRFFIIIRMSWQKNGGKKCAKQFFQKHTNSVSKKCWEKIVIKKWKKRFLYSRDIVNKNGGKNHENIFPETHE